ncbi:SpoIIE family protein phosphatase [Nocardia sp. 2]|uniref:SpoIIE family protein phosphatase n=1 Tax=Nocardia acididurans TaxID=2802282 RepID=A0ABS1MF85_9NOCA|nr:SpoIIE family protein phosphatase [Nocardia acididurans]MBL1079325.1 SpoIIE family protein phosphatase [Nocardia acididurans]
MAGHADNDSPTSRIGDARVVREVFEAMPFMLFGLEGPDHTCTAVNAAFRKMTGRTELLGRPIREVVPEAAGQQVFAVLDRVYTTGEPEAAREWRVQVDRSGTGILEEVFVDFMVTPKSTGRGEITGLLVAAIDVTARVRQRQAEQRRAAEAEQRYRAVRDVVAELQNALLPRGLPILPGTHIAARYLVAGRDQAAGGDWFDAVVLPDGWVALIVGDVVGHGVAASAAMGRLRAVLDEALISAPDVETALARADSYAAADPALRAATLAVVVLDPIGGGFRYATLGHPPPLIVGAGGAARFLEPTGDGPLGLGAKPRWDSWFGPDARPGVRGPLGYVPKIKGESRFGFGALSGVGGLIGTGAASGVGGRAGAGAKPLLISDTLAVGETVLLYSDGLVERPGRPLSDGLAELAQVAADAAANRVFPRGAAPTPAERVCQLTVELLTRRGYDDDVTTLAAQRLTAPAAALVVDLDDGYAGVSRTRHEFSDWLDEFGVLDDTRSTLELAVDEVVTNAVEHAYRPGRPGPVRVEAGLLEDGVLQVRVIDQGRWREPDPVDTSRGLGLVVVEQLVDELRVAHPPQDAADPRGSRGTVVTLRHRLHRLAMLASDTVAVPVPNGERPVFTTVVDTLATQPLLSVRGPIDVTTVEEFSRRMLTACRGGVLDLTVDLTEATLLASVGVRALHNLREQMAAHQQRLTLIAAPDSLAHTVLALVGLSHLPSIDARR